MVEKGLMNDTAYGFSFDGKTNQNSDMIQQSLSELRGAIQRIYPNHHIFILHILKLIWTTVWQNWFF